MATALNKILKDFVVKSQTMLANVRGTSLVGIVMGFRSNTKVVKESRELSVL